MLLYCDHCATKHGYDVEPEKKHKGECELCRRRLGPMNAMTDDDVEVLVNGVIPETYDIAGFKAVQVKGFPVGTKIAEIEAKMPIHKVLSPNCVAFFDPGKIVIANPKTGKRFQITF